MSVGLTRRSGQSWDKKKKDFKDKDCNYEGIGFEKEDCQAVEIVKIFVRMEKLGNGQHCVQ